MHSVQFEHPAQPTNSFADTVKLHLLRPTQSRWKTACELLAWQPCTMAKVFVPFDKQLPDGVPNDANITSSILLPGPAHSTETASFSGAEMQVPDEASLQRIPELSVSV